MKVLALAAASVGVQGRNLETATIRGEIRVIEKPHNTCDQGQVPDDYICYENEDAKLMCEAPCNGGQKRMYCECYRKRGFILMYDASRCAWNAFDDACFPEEESFTPPLTTSTVTTAEPTTQKTVRTTKSAPPPPPGKN